MHISAVGITHVGMKRKKNQDNYLLLPEAGLFVVADGMGGHRGGETASQIAVDSIGAYFRGRLEENSATTDPKRSLTEAIVSANEAIQAEGKREPSLQGMGTTATSLLLIGNQAYFGHVGDSRAYLVQNGKIWQLTRDHSLVQEKLRAGLITREQLKTDQLRNVITRSVGFDDKVEIDLYVVNINPEDIFLICSDGLSGMLEDDEIQQIVQTFAIDERNPEKAAQTLIDKANENGGDDNVTAVLVKVDGR